MFGYYYLVYGVVVFDVVLGLSEYLVFQQILYQVYCENGVCFVVGEVQVCGYGYGQCMGDVVSGIDYGKSRVMEWWVWMIVGW